MKTLDVALDYLNRGFSVIPVNREDKKPFVKWAGYQKKLATPDELKAMWNQWPNAMIGIVTGKLSGICGVDFDRYAEDFDQNIELEYFPENLVTPTAETPRGGHHMYFSFPEGLNLTINARALPGIDFRGEGGYLIAPPSRNGDGKGYEWLPGLSLDDVPLAPPPLAYISFLKSNIRDHKVKSYDELHRATESYESYGKLFTKGRRDEDLFSAANALIKGGMQEALARNVLQRLAFSCNPPFSQKDAQVKIDSALSRVARRERNLSEEIRNWVKATEGYFFTTEVHAELRLATAEEKNACYSTLLRMRESGEIEKHGKRRGCFRNIDRNFERVDFLGASGSEFEIDLPLGIGHFGKLYPGNIAVIAGSKEGGKTSLLLNIAALNLARRRVVYLNSEMGQDEFRNRLLPFEGISLERWAEKMPAFYLKSTQVPADFIDGSKTIWIVDFLEIAEDFSKIAVLIAGIHEKLKKGVAVIALQKAEGKEIGRGADFSREKARLYLSLDWDWEKRANRIKIIDCKSWRGKINPRGKYRHFNLVQGTKIVPKGDWQG